MIFQISRIKANLENRMEGAKVRCLVHKFFFGDGGRVSSAIRESIRFRWSVRILHSGTLSPFGPLQVDYVDHALKSVVIIFSAFRRAFAFFGEVSPRKVHCIEYVFGVWQWRGPRIQHTSAL